MSSTTRNGFFLFIICIFMSSVRREKNIFLREERSYWWVEYILNKNIFFRKKFLRIFLKYPTHVNFWFFYISREIQFKNFHPTQFFTKRLNTVLTSSSSFFSNTKEKFSSLLKPKKIYMWMINIWCEKKINKWENFQRDWREL